jgi:hypothetical protein
LNPSPDASVLFALAEISVAFAGFSAIVVLFKRRDSGKWQAADADRFHGMVLHAMAAVFFCLLPSIVGVFTDRAALVWNLSSAALGIQITLHIALVMNFASTTGASRVLLGLGFVPAGVQALNVLGIGFAHEFAAYLFGVVWHVFQSGVLFVVLIWIPDEDLEAG